MARRRPAMARAAAPAATTACAIFCGDEESHHCCYRRRRRRHHACRPSPPLALRILELYLTGKPAECVAGRGSTAMRANVRVGILKAEVFEVRPSAYGNAPDVAEPPGPDAALAAARTTRPPAWAYHRQVWPPGCSRGQGGLCARSSASSRSRPAMSMLPYASGMAAPPPPAPAPARGSDDLRAACHCSCSASCSTLGVLSRAVSVAPSRWATPADERLHAIP